MLLDTCALLWLSQGGDALSSVAKARIESAATVYVSVISGFEIGIKCRSGKLMLPASPDEWLSTVLAHHGLAAVPLDLSTCMLASQLPQVHRDPCDRMIIATARQNRWPIVTADARFKEYGVEVIW